VLTDIRALADQFLIAFPNINNSQSSPLLYRIGPLAYEPTVLYNCKLKACRWISWSNRQPGWRYYQCRRARVRNYDQMPSVVVFD